MLKNKERAEVGILTDAGSSVRPERKRKKRKTRPKIRAGSIWREWTNCGLQFHLGIGDAQSAQLQIDAGAGLRI